MHLVIADHASTYPDPLSLAKGESFNLSGKTDDWDGNSWLWAQACNGREGWVPDDLPVEQNSGTIAAYDYDARELDVLANDHLKVLRQSHGWAWCIDDAGKEGWVPEKALQLCKRKLHEYS